MKTKRILSIILASLLLLGIAPLTAQANPDDFPHQVIISFVTGTGMHMLEAVFVPRTITLTLDAGDGVVSPAYIERACKL